MTWGAEHFATQESWVAIGSFSVQGLLENAPSAVGIPITLSGKVSGAITAEGSDGPWTGTFSGAVDSVKLPTGLPASESQELLNSLGDLSRFHLVGGVSPFSWAQGPPSTYTLSMSFVVDPNENAIPEPGTLVVYSTLIAACALSAIRGRREGGPPARVSGGA
jgi:hypothetical protein